MTASVNTLWLVFPEDSLSRRAFGPEARARFAQVFSVADEKAPWMRALRLVGLAPPLPDTRMTAWRGGVPYMNGSALARVLSGGTAEAVPCPQNGFRFFTPHPLRSLPRVMALQWRVTRFVQDRLRGLAAPDDDPLVESLALGLAVQVLLMRLSRPLAENMPLYLVAPDRAPRMHRQTFRWLQALQLRRTALSGAWREMFADAPLLPDTAPRPGFFWGAEDPQDTEMPAQATAPEAASPSAAAEVYRGHPVSGARAEGICAVVARLEDQPPPRTDRPVYVFRHARPETVSYFPQAGGVVFAHGGVLSHACVVAREMGVPCVTGVGDAFYEHVRNAGDLRLGVDGSSGEIRIISC